MVLARDIRDIPSGRNVTNRFPWLAQGEFDHTLGNQGRFVINPRDESFKNKTDGDIEIHEIRLLFAEADAIRNKPTFADRSWDARIQTNTTRRNLIEKWIPARCLGNRPHDVQAKPKIATKFRLPTPWFLQHSARFKIDMRISPNMPLSDNRIVIADVDVDVALRGWDPDNNVAVVMNKQETMPAALADAPTTISFDEEMDTALRHMVIDDISFGFVDPLIGISADFGCHGPGGPAYHADVRFHPNTGPEWVEGNDGWIRLSGISSPPPTLMASDKSAVSYFPYIVHRPESPIILKPKDEFNMLVKMEADPTQGYDYSRYYCWVIGTQEWRGN